MARFRGRFCHASDSGVRRPIILMMENPVTRNSPGGTAHTTGHQTMRETRLNRFLQFKAYSNDLDVSHKRGIKHTSRIALTMGRQSAKRSGHRKRSDTVKRCEASISYWKARDPKCGICQIRLRKRQFLGELRVKRDTTREIELGRRASRRTERRSAIASHIVGSRGCTFRAALRHL